MSLLGLTNSKLVGTWLKGRAVKRKIFYTYPVKSSPLMGLYYLMKYGMTLKEFHSICNNIFKRVVRKGDKIIVKTKHGPKALTTFPITFQRSVHARLQKRRKNGRFK